MKLVSKLALAAALAAPCLAFADDATTSTAPASPNTGALSFSGGADVVSAYYFRGYLQENRGFIIEPYFGVATTLVSTDDYKIGASVSTWNSFHSEDTRADGGTSSWYENDIYISLPVSFGNFTVTPSYYIYQYPNGNQDTIQEALLTVAYDDSALWKDKMPDSMVGFKLAPYATLVYELDDGSQGVTRTGHTFDLDGYFEVGIAPTFSTTVAGYTLPLTFPVALGMSFDDYYVNDPGHNSWFGYLSVGVQTSIPLTFIDPKFGTYAIDVGGYYMNLLADSVEEANHGESNVFWGKIGFTFAY